MRIASLRVGQRWLAVGSFVALAAFPLQGLAQEDDLPGRVGRLADFAGQIFLSSQDRPADWEAIGLNYPITSGGNLWVPGDGRAEVDYGGGQFRLAGDTSVHVSRLDDRQLALFIARGEVIVRVRAQDPGDATRIDTPNTQVMLTRPGLYRIDVAPDRQATTLTVREGEAEIALASDVQQALPGQTVVVTGTDAADADIRPAQGADGFDAWSATRDRRYDRARSATYVSREMVGYADLDPYGSWQSYPDYGAVWFPTAVAPGWAPYRDGYWTEVGGWGPTWVDSAPWGYAPFHYGRWAHIGGRWGWCPGAYTRRPAWAPALVAWYGGSRWGASAGHGAPAYGWVPLGWREPYHPTWRQCSFNCWARYNRPYAVNATARPGAPPARYANLDVPGALSAVADTNWARRRPVAPNLLNVPRSLVTSAPVMAGAPPMGSRTRPASDAAPGRDVPPAVSTHVRVSPPEPPSPRATFRPGSSGGSGASVRPAPPQVLPPQEVATPAMAPRRIRAPADAASPMPAPRMLPPVTPSQPAPASLARPSATVPQVVPTPALVAPAPSPQGQAAPAAPSNARGGRAGGDKALPDMPLGGATPIK